MGVSAIACASEGYVMVGRCSGIWRRVGTEWGMTSLCACWSRVESGLSYEEGADIGMESDIVTGMSMRWCV